MERKPKTELADDEIEVTPEMIESGVEAYDADFLKICPYEPGGIPDVVGIYRAMEVARQGAVERPAPKPGKV